MDPRGVRYNNPFDVSLPIQGWTGGGTVVGAPGQPGFASFPDQETGIRAGIQRVANYIRAKGLNTIGTIGSRYATDKNWPAAVSRISGLRVDETIDPNNPAQMAALTHGILTQELGAKHANAISPKVAGILGTASPIATTTPAAAPATPIAMTTPALAPSAAPTPVTQPTGLLGGTPQTQITANTPAQAAPAPTKGITGQGLQKFGQALSDIAARSSQEDPLAAEYMRDFAQRAAAQYAALQKGALI